MNPRLLARPLFVAAALFLGLGSLLTDLRALTSAELHARMGRGINYGQYYDNQGLRHDKNRPAIPLAHFQAIRAAGFSHVRLPVTWGYRMYFPNDSTGAIGIKADFINSVKASVDNAIDAGLVVIVDSHHERWFQYYWAAKGDVSDIKLRESLTEPHSGGKPWDYVVTPRASGGRKASEIYRAIYTKLAQTFRDAKYDVVILEGLNEPRKQVEDKDGSGALIDAFPLNSTGHGRVNEVNRMLFETVQNAYVSGYGDRRTFMMSVNDMNNAYSFRHLTMPSYGGWSASARRNLLMVTLHYYHSMPWTHDTTPHQNTWGSAQDYADVIARLNLIDSSVPTNFDQTSSPLVGVPVNIGEFGVAHRQRTTRNSDDVLEWYRAVSAGALERNLSATVWCDNGWFRVFNQTDGNFTHPGEPDYVNEIWKQVTLFENRWRLVSKASSSNRLAVDSVADFTKWYLRTAAAGDAQTFTLEVDPYARLSGNNRLKYFALRNENGGANGRYIDLANNSSTSGTQVQSGTLPLDTVLDHYVFLGFEDGTGSFRLVTPLNQQEFPETSAGDMVVAAPNGVNAIVVLNARGANNNQRWVLEKAP